MAPAKPIDAVALAAELIRCASVTPTDAGALDALSAALEPLGFACRRMPSGGIDNLYARFGRGGPNFCFAGHTDVVPAGDEAAWTSPPFAGRIAGGVLHGRGAADMKGAIAAFAASATRLIAEAPPAGSISLLITGDEEGIAEHGTKAMVATLTGEGERIDHCLVGEPTSAAVLGDMIKIGRRGSLNTLIEVDGIQGHVAYPDRAANPVPVLVGLLSRLIGRRLDDGFEAFQPSNLEVTSMDVGNPATNVIPARASARLNIRFNPAHTGAQLAAWIEAEARAAGKGFEGRVTATTTISGEAFLTARGPFTDLVAQAVREVTGQEPELSTTGGTSDARFIRAMCPVVEFGLVGASMHKVDEQASVEDIEALARVYHHLLGSYFAGASA
jgi:succinyl-diaminopimelate desuccinylase